MKLIYYLILTSINISLTIASSGDRLYEFKDCVEQCIAKRCPRSMGLLTLMAWDCPSDCDYICQQALTDVHERENMIIHQYHGKWPFKRILGIQEPASVGFSLLNFLPNYLGYKILQREKKSDRFVLKSYYKLFAIVGMNTWVWSSVFHTRDLPVTEKLDYFGANGQVLYGMFLALVRMFRLDLPDKRLTRYTAALTCLGFYLYHISYLSFVKFDYGYNMLVGVVIGVLQTFFWVLLGIRLYLHTREKMDLLPVVLILSVMLGVSFELFEFTPYRRFIDAHSLWHASTALPTYFWYKWMIFDLRRQRRYASDLQKKE